MKIEPLLWSDNTLEMIDQRILPAAFEYLSYDSAASVAEDIRSMVVRGAQVYGVAMGFVLAEQVCVRLQSRHGGWLYSIRYYR